MKNFLRKWGKFLGIVFSPGSITPLAVAVISLYFAFSNPGTLISVILSIIASILTAITGFFIKDDWDKMRGDSILEKKGQSAIRNLSSIGQQIGFIRSWIKLFISKKATTKRELEEIDRHLGTTDMNITAGLKDWIDIVPELKKAEEVVKIYEDVIKVHIEELLKNKKELLEAGENQELRERLEKRIKELEKSVKELKREQPQVLGSGFGDSSRINPVGLSVIFSSNLVSGLYNKICSRCNRQYTEDPLSISLSYSNLCPECRANLGGIGVG